VRGQLTRREIQIRSLNLHKDQAQRICEHVPRRQDMPIMSISHKISEFGEKNTNRKVSDGKVISARHIRTIPSITDKQTVLNQILV
jgi:hypothetical protein